MVNPFSAPAWRAVVAAVAVFTFAVLAFGPAHAQQRRDPATMLLAADVRDAPGPRARVLRTVPAGARVFVLEMRGADARIQGDPQRGEAWEGWVGASQLRLGEATAGAGGGGSGASSLLRGLTGLLGGGRSGGDGSKVPIGLRGLQAQDLANARPDRGAVDALERYAMPARQAVAFAQSQGLRSRVYNYVRAPAGRSAPAPTRGGGPDQ